MNLLAITFEYCRIRSLSKLFQFNICFSFTKWWIALQKIHLKFRNIFARLVVTASSRASVIDVYFATLTHRLLILFFALYKQKKQQQQYIVNNKYCKMHKLTPNALKRFRLGLSRSCLFRKTSDLGRGGFLGLIITRVSSLISSSKSLLSEETDNCLCTWPWLPDQSNDNKKVAN